MPRRVSFMRNTIPLAYTAVPTNVTKSIGHVRQNSGHVPRIPSVTFTGMSVTLPESAVTLDRNTQLQPTNRVARSV